MSWWQLQRHQHWEPGCYSLSCRCVCQCTTNGQAPFWLRTFDHGICLQCGYRETSRETSQRRKRTRRKSFKGKLQYVLDWYPPLNSLIAAIVKSQLSVLIHLICAGNYNVTDGCYTATGTCDKDDYINSRVSSWKKQSSCLVSSFTSSHCFRPAPDDEILSWCKGHSKWFRQVATSKFLLDWAKSGTPHAGSAKETPTTNGPCMIHVCPCTWPRNLDAQATIRV